jgi:ankyrin repeat protein
MNEYLDIVNALIHAHADVNIQNKDGYTALHFGIILIYDK